MLLFLNNQFFSPKLKSIMLVIEAAPLSQFKKMLIKGFACILSDSAKDDNIIKDNEVTEHSICEQDHPKGKL
jgi:hypothetical protein